MKKKHKQVKKITHKIRNTGARSFTIIPWKKIIIVSMGLVVLLFTVIITHKQTITQSVAGMSIMKGLFSEATIQIPHINGTVSMNIYYKRISDPAFVYAIRNIPPNVSTYTVSYLKKGEKYQYKTAAVGVKGAEIWFSDVMPITNTEPM